LFEIVDVEVDTLTNVYFFVRAKSLRKRELKAKTVEGVKNAVQRVRAVNQQVMECFSNCYENHLTYKSNRFGGACNLTTFELKQSDGRNAYNYTRATEERKKKNCMWLVFGFGGFFVVVLASNWE
jgi:hypothetical protein